MSPTAPKISIANFAKWPSKGSVKEDEIIEAMAISSLNKPKWVALFVTLSKSLRTDPLGLFVAYTVPVAITLYKQPILDFKKYVLLWRSEISAANSILLVVTHLRIFDI